MVDWVVVDCTTNAVSSSRLKLFWMVTVLTFVIMLLKWYLPWRKEQNFSEKICI